MLAAFKTQVVVGGGLTSEPEVKPPPTTTCYYLRVRLPVQDFSLT